MERYTADSEIDLVENELLEVMAVWLVTLPVDMIFKNIFLPVFFHSVNIISWAPSSASAHYSGHREN